MNKNNFSILKFAFSTRKLFIRNKEFPVCSNCLYYIEHTNNYPYDSLPDNKKHGKCKKFGEVNIITGVIEYDFANDCRNNMNKCGKNALEYTYKQNQNKSNDIIYL